jgi:glycosyltransferase involved in cell wall biosynthesis
MRIILDLQACQASSMHRGIGRYSIALAMAMARNSGSHDLHLALNEAFPDSVAALRQAFDGLVPQSSISTYVTPLPAAEADLGNAWRVRAGERIREHYLASLRPDVVHVASLFEGLSDNSVSSVLHGAGHFDTAVTLYDLIPLLRKERYLSDPNIAAWYYRKLESLRQAELLLAISGHAREEAIGVLQLAPDTVVNISSAVDDIFRPRSLAPQAQVELLARHGLHRPFIMYTGGIDYRKNIEGLIEAYAALPGALRRQYQLAVVCSIHEPDRVRLTRLAAKCGLADDDLVLTGFVSDDDLVSLYNCTALFVFPSLHEGFGLPALEAMACGAAVIGSDASSIPEVIGRADALFDPTSVPAITAAMAGVLNDPAYAAELRAHGLVQSKKFSWDASARCALAAFEETHARRAAGPLVVPAMAPARPRLAYVSPLPPLRSGIADYSADLLPELARFYDIELVLAQDGTDHPAIDTAFPTRSLDWFEEHAHSFDRILYQFGNSAFHAHMFDMLARHPGVVVLHDFFLSGVLNYAENSHPLPNHYCRSLYLAHGYPALIDEAAQGRFASCQAYPCNKSILDNANGVIVHSQHALGLARRWYGDAFARDWRMLPLLRKLPAAVDKGAARRELGLRDDDFVLCTFGIIAPPKCNDAIVEAWLASDLARDPHCHLVLAGEAGNDQFGLALRDRVASHPRVRITGYTSDAVYHTWLAAADGAIQLRRDSRGETSGAILDCLAAGLPTILNAHGSAAEIPAEVCLRLEDVCTTGELRAAIEALHADPALRMRLARAARGQIEAVHTPARIGVLMRDAIEAAHGGSRGAAELRLVAGLAAISAATPRPDLLQVAAAIAANRSRRGAHQLLLDISAMAKGATAVPIPELPSLVRRLFAATPAGWRIEPVRWDGSRYQYARQLTLGLIGRNDLEIEDSVAEVHAGDLLLTLGDQGALPSPAPKLPSGLGRLVVTPAQAPAGGTAGAPALGVDLRIDPPLASTLAVLADGLARHAPAIGWHLNPAQDGATHTAMRLSGPYAGNAKTLIPLLAALVQAAAADA